MALHKKEGSALPGAGQQERPRLLLLEQCTYGLALARL
jgi:hypothetical protein